MGATAQEYVINPMRILPFNLADLRPKTSRADSVLPPCIPCFRG